MNNVILIGRLTRDPDLRYTGEGTAIARFTLAINRPTKDNKADFIQIMAFGKQAENVAAYLKKGNQCAVNGSIRTGSYVNKDGQKVYTTDVYANNVEFLGGRGKENGGDFFDGIDTDDNPF